MANKTNIEIIYTKEKRSFINIIKNFGLLSKGIIFGGLVRDEIIGCHFRKEFFNKKLDKNSYWDENYNIETVKRLILPNDMDIYFKYSNDSKEFINRIHKFVAMFGGNVNIARTTDRHNLNQLRYVDHNLVLKHNKVNIEVVIGKTFRNKGIKLKFSIDIITTDENQYQRDSYYKTLIDNIEPPFNNLDFLCNSFIMEKINGYSTIRLSNYTGTPLDKMNLIDKTRFSITIIDDIIQHKTMFTRSINSFSSETTNCFRIIKMIDRQGFSWNITNLPFRIFQASEITKPIDDLCCICRDDIKLAVGNDSNEKITELNTNKNKTNIIHFECFIQYLYNENKTKYRSNDTNQIECRCPFRNLFNFKECYKSVKYL